MVKTVECGRTGAAPLEGGERGVKWRVRVKRSKKVRNGLGRVKWPKSKNPSSGQRVRNMVKSEAARAGRGLTRARPTCAPASVRAARARPCEKKGGGGGLGDADDAGEPGARLRYAPHGASGRAGAARRLSLSVPLPLLDVLPPSRPLPLPLPSLRPTPSPFPFLLSLLLFLSAPHLEHHGFERKQNFLPFSSLPSPLPPSLLLFLRKVSHRQHQDPHRFANEYYTCITT